MRLELATSPVAVSKELDPSYIKPSDYLRPCAGGVVVGLSYFSLVLFPFLFVHPAIYFSGVVSFAIPTFLLFLFSAFIHHQLWIYRLKKYGTDAFEVFHDLEMNADQAFELCLAATTQLKDSRIETCNESEGVIKVRVKGNFWVTVDRVVDIVIDQVSPDKTRVKVASVINLTPARTYLIEKAWGPKWQPLLFRTDVSKNRKIMDALLVYLQSIPNWDYKYVPAAQFEKALTERAQRQ